MKPERIYYICLVPFTIMALAAFDILDIIFQAVMIFWKRTQVNYAKIKEIWGEI